MNGFKGDCGRAVRDLLNYESLDAVKRGRLELHLRRCETCRSAAEGLSFIQNSKPPVPEDVDDRARSIYDRLVPSVHQIAVDLAERPKRTFFRPVLVMAWGFGAAAAVLLAVLVSMNTAQEPQGTDKVIVGAAEVTGVVEYSGLVDRCEGTAVIDGDEVRKGDGTFTVSKGTEAAVMEGARLNFRIGDALRVALVDDTRWRVSEATGSFLEMELDMGRLAVEFDGSGGRMLDIRTPDSIVRVRGTTFTVEVIPSGGTQVAVVEGRVDVVPLVGPSRIVELTGGQRVVVPVMDGVDDLNDAQRALAGEILDLEDSFVATAGRLVNFDGTPERVKVEVEGRLLGYSPLTVRLPDGPVEYRLSAPGMEPINERLAHEQVGENVSFEMAPAAEYQPIVLPRPAKKYRKSPDVIEEDTDEPVKWGLVERAHAAMTAGDMSFAIGLLENVSREAEGDDLLTGLSALAECYSAVGKYEDAADTFERVASISPGSKIAQNSYYEVGRIAMDRIGDFGRARAAFTAYVASPLEGDFKEAAYFSLCELDGREGNHREALHCFNNFLRTFPGGIHQPNARLWRGALYQDVLKRWADAERDLLAFLEEKPRHPRAEEARYRVALGRYQVGDERGALRMLEEYLTEHPGGQYKIRAMRLKRAIVDPDFSLEPDSK